jgi:hypothetical protein
MRKLHLVLLVDVAGPRVDEVIAAGIHKITATRPIASAAASVSLGSLPDPWPAD